MRWVAAVLLVLLGLGFVAAVLPRSGPEGRAPDPWRRTAAGWERWSQWPTAPPPAPPPLHPAVVAALQLGISLLALAGLPCGAENTQGPRQNKGLSQKGV